MANTKKGNDKSSTKKKTTRSKKQQNKITLKETKQNKTVSAKNKIAKNQQQEKNTTVRNQMLTHKDLIHNIAGIFLVIGMVAILIEVSKSDIESYVFEDYAYLAVSYIVFIVGNIGLINLSTKKAINITSLIINIILIIIMIFKYNVFSII